MTKRSVLVIAVCVIAIITSFICWLHVHRTDGTKTALDAPGNSYSSTASSQPVSRQLHPGATTIDTRMVSPTSHLTEMIEEYESTQIEDASRLVKYAEAARIWQAARARGDKVWYPQEGEWIKPLDYYRKLDTIALTLECFERPIFGFEMTIYDDPMYGLIRLKYMHNGFSELFKRSDMWQGILQLYKHLGDQLSPDASLETLVIASLDLQSLQYFWLLPEFKAQAKGREYLFLKAHLRVMRQYIDYIDSFDPNVIGVPTPGFFCEPIDLANMALVLARQVDPKTYKAIEPRIRELRFLKKQNIADVRAFLNTVLHDLEGIQNNQGQAPGSCLQ